MKHVLFYVYNVKVEDTIIFMHTIDAKKIKNTTQKMSLIFGDLYEISKEQAEIYKKDGYVIFFLFKSKYYTFDEFQHFPMTWQHVYESLCKVRRNEKKI